MSVELSATEYGEGPPVLVLHGLFGSGRNWTSIAQKLTRSHRVFAIDLRNHGASAWADSMAYADMVEDVRNFVKARDLGRVALIGHSMGGKAAMLMALQDSAMVDRLVVVDVAPMAYPPTLLTHVHAMQAVDLSRVTRRGDADAQLASAVPNPAERAFLLQNLVLEGEGARWRLNLDVLERTLGGISGFPALPPGSVYSGPTLFVAGGRSDYVRPEHEPEIRRLFPRAEIVRIPDSGHWVHAERGEEFLRIVTPFLADRAGGTQEGRDVSV